MDGISLGEHKVSGSRLVHDILNKHLENTGKLVRPTLMAKLGSMFGLAEIDYQHLSRASELIHNATLIHDDVIDESQMRRDRSTLNSSLSNAHAVLAGDYLLANVIAELVSVKQYDHLKTLSQTLEQIIEGEFLQNDLKTRGDVTYEDLVDVSYKKTGALMAWCCQAVAQTAKMDQEICLLGERLGQQTGLAFQMMDDVLDYSHESGKEYAKDLKEGLINFTTLNLIKLHPELMFPVYQLRGRKMFNPPWNEFQMTDAILATKKDSDQIFEEIFKLVEEIAEKANVSALTTSYQNLKFFLEKLQDRNK